MANPNKTVWNARHRKFSFRDISDHPTYYEAQLAATAARNSGEWGRVKVQTYKWTSRVWVRGVAKATKAE